MTSHHAFQVTLTSLCDLILMSVEKSTVVASITPRHVARHKALLFSLLALISVAAFSLFWYQHHQAASLPAPDPLARFDIIPVQHGDIEQTISASGKLQLYKYADINATISGQIHQVLVAIGDDVKAGELLLKIEPNLSVAHSDNNQAQLARLRAELAEQTSQLDFAELQFKRQSQLKAQNATREESFEASRAAMGSATARVNAINARIQQTEATIKDEQEMRKHSAVTAPFAGTVVSLAARPGQMVNANQQTSPLMRIADLSKLTVQARVAEIDVPHLHRGMAAYFMTPGYPGKRWSGKIRQVIPVPAEGSGAPGHNTFYNVLFDVNNHDQKLMSGMSAEVSFIIADADDATLLPVSVLGKPDADGLYPLTVVTPDKQLRARKVRIGIQNRQQAQVLSGLAADEKVVIPKQHSQPAKPSV